MSLRKQQQETVKGGALVPASMPAVNERADTADQAASPLGTRAIIATRSVFLAQLASQYESKDAACARRMETRAFAAHRYDEKPLQPALRHLLWA